MEILHTENHSHRHREITGSLLIRYIRDTIERIRKDAAFILVPFREETVYATLSMFLRPARISLKDADDNIMDAGGNATNPVPDLSPLATTEINSALDAIQGLTAVEKVTIADDLR